MRYDPVNKCYWVNLRDHMTAPSIGLPVGSLGAAARADGGRVMSVRRLHMSARWR